jgi:hypothetical protein
MELTVRDNQGTTRTVTLAGAPSKGDKILLSETGGEQHDVSVKEVIWSDDGTAVVVVVDGFVAR